MTRAIITIAFAIAIGLCTSANHTRAADDILSRSIAAYAALKSYADTGAIVWSRRTSGSGWRPLVRLPPPG